MVPVLIYWLSHDSDVRRVLDSLESRFTVRGDPPVRRRTTYLDTFDWRLFRKGLRLATISSNGSTEMSVESADGQQRCGLPSGVFPAFGDDLAPGPLAAVVAPIIGVRRLLPVVDVDALVEPMRVVNTDEKTVVRARVERGTAAPPGQPDPSRQLPPLFRASAVKGYDGALHQLAQCLATRLGIGPSRIDPFLMAVERIGGRPGSYSSKPVLSLHADMTAHEATIAIHGRLLATILANEDGVRRNLDPEFLHDFRVAMRRTRSVLGQIRRVLPAETADRLRTELKWMGAVTGPARDLDVFLLEMDAYRDRLLSERRRDLDPLEQFVRTQQQEAHRRLADALDSARYRDLIADWSTYLERPRPATAVPPNASRPVGALASRRIWRLFRRVRKLGATIDKASPPEALHALRIECKKLRYVLECFASLYPVQDLSALVSALKRLQDHLGTFNDLEVQQPTLVRFAREMAAAGTGSVDTFVAVGGLVEQLRRAQQKERARFARCFRAFKHASGRGRLQRLFGEDGRR